MSAREKQTHKRSTKISSAKSKYTAATRTAQCKSLLKLLSDERFNFNDVTFIIGENKKEIKANRALLSVHSDVFKAMLFGPMIESQLNAEIEILDVESEAFESGLQFFIVIIQN